MKIESVRKFYNNNYQRFVVENERHKQVFESIDRFIPKGTAVLDIGCGAGFTSRHLAEGNRNVLAVELSPVLLEWAKKHNNHKNISYLENDITELKTTDKFDAIVMVDVLEHILPDRVQALFKLLSKVSHEATKVYLNIPSPDVLRFLKENNFDALQVVDEPMDNVLSLFRSIGFLPVYFRFYWMQYVEYLFFTQHEFNRVLSTGYKIKEQG